MRGILDSKSAKCYADELVETIETLEGRIADLDQKLIDDVKVAHDKGYDEGYGQCERDMKPKAFQFR